MLNYVNRVHVGLASGADSGNDTLTSLGRGDMLVLDSEMTPITAAAADNAGPRKSFYVAIGTGYAASPFILSAPIFGDQVSSYTGKTTRAAADQESTVSVIAPAIGDVANVVIAFKDRLRLIANRQSRLVLTAEAATVEAYDLASDLAKQASFSSPYSDPYGIKVEVTTNGTPTYLTLTEDVTVTKGSTSVAFASDPSFSAGDLIVIQGITYKLIEASASAGTLDRRYAGDSEVIDVSVATTAVGSLATVTTAALKVTGVDSPYNNPEIDVYEKPVFEIGSDQAAAVVTVVTKADLGQGIDKQVKKMEFDVQHNLGNSNLRQWPIPTFDYHTVAGTSYDVIQITASDEHEGDLQGKMKSPVGLTIAFSSTASGQRDNIDAIIESLLPGAAAISW